MKKITGEWLNNQWREICFANNMNDKDFQRIGWWELADRINKLVENEVTTAYEKGYFAGYHSTLGITQKETDGKEK